MCICLSVFFSALVSHGILSPVPCALPRGLLLIRPVWSNWCLLTPHPQEDQGQMEGMVLLTWGSSLGSGAELAQGFPKKNPECRPTGLQRQ